MNENLNYLTKMMLNRYSCNPDYVEDCYSTPPVQINVCEGATSASVAAGVLMSKMSVEEGKAFLQTLYEQQRTPTPNPAPTALPAPEPAPAPDATVIAFQCANKATLNTAKATAKRFLKLEFEQKKATATTAADAFALADAYQKAVAEVTAAENEDDVWAVTL